MCFNDKEYFVIRVVNTNIFELCNSMIFVCL